MWQRSNREALGKEYCCLAEEWFNGFNNTRSASNNYSIYGRAFLELILIVYNFYCKKPTLDKLENPSFFFYSNWQPLPNYNHCKHLMLFSLTISLVTWVSLCVGSDFSSSSQSQQALMQTSQYHFVPNGSSFQYSLASWQEGVASNLIDKGKIDTMQSLLKLGLRFFRHHPSTILWCCTRIAVYSPTSNSIATSEQ